MFSDLFRSAVSAVSAVSVMLCLAASSTAVVGSTIVEDGGLIIAPPLIVETEVTHTVHRLTRNRVSDANPFLKDSKIYWERFGGDEGDTEVFSYHVRFNKRTRETTNPLGDYLQGPGVWTRGPITEPPLDENGLVDSSALLEPKYQRISNRNARRVEIIRYGRRLTHNRRQERSVRVADNSLDGMVWLSRKVPVGGYGALQTGANGFDVFWFDPRTKQTVRLNETPDANSLAFDGTWAVWTSPGTSSPFSIVADKLTLHNVHTDETRTIDAEAPINLQVLGQHVMYNTSSGNTNPDPGIGGLLVSSGNETRLMVYDVDADTTIEVGADPDLGYHRDIEGRLSDRYLAYNRSFRDLSVIVGVPQVYPSPSLPPDITELRLFDLDTLNDILITEGQRISGLQIDGDTVVWQMLDTGDPLEENWDLEIYAYDIVSETIRQVTDNLVDDRAPRIEDDIIVWTTYLKNGQTEIYYEVTDTFSFIRGSLPIDLTDITWPVVGTLEPVEGREVASLASMVAVPEPASALILSLAGLPIIRRRQDR